MFGNTKGLRSKGLSPFPFQGGRGVGLAACCPKATPELAKLEAIAATPPPVRKLSSARKLAKKPLSTRKLSGGKR